MFSSSSSHMHHLKQLKQQGPFKTAFPNEHEQSWSHYSLFCHCKFCPKSAIVHTYPKKSQNTGLSENPNKKVRTQGTTEQNDIPLVLWVKKPYIWVSQNMSSFSVLESQFSFEDFTIFGWLSGCTAALFEGPVQQLQVHWHPSRLHSRDYCAAADKFCWRHVLLSPHTNRADPMLWGNFRGCTFIEKTQKAQCFWTLSTPLPACCSAALLQLSKYGVSQEHQMSTPEARVCRWSV